MAERPAESVSFTLDGDTVVAPGDGSLLDALREHLGVVSVKDGCSPQGQCGCCTVWIDGRPRVSCVTPVTRARGRSVTTVDGLEGASAWATTFSDHGGSQCGFCTPGIIMRAAALADPTDEEAVRQAMLAHLCRCTGWQPIVESVVGVADARRSTASPRPPADRARAEQRAALEGGVPQSVGPDVALGRGGFADDVAPADALVALPDPSGGWVVGDTLAEARALSGKVQGRRTTAPLTWPVDVPVGSWVRTLQTTWVEPAYLEPDASWCRPGGEPMSSLGNGGAFGGKVGEELGAVARRLADEHGRPVRVLRSREEVVRRGPKRPPLAAGIADDGSGVIRVARTQGIVAVIRSLVPDWEIVEVDVVGPPTSTALRGAGWVEAAVLLAAAQDSDVVVAPSGAAATAAFLPDGSLSVGVRCGEPLDPVVLRSYCVGAAHMALGWVTSEGLSVGEDGVPSDLTIRSFGILRAVDTPSVDVDIVDEDGPPVNGSDAVFAAVAAAAWRRSGWAPRWPVTDGV